MSAIPVDQQQSVVERLTSACGGSYTPEQRRKFFITGPQWAANYEGHSLFQDKTRAAVSFERVIEEYARIGIGYWCTHDTDVIPTDQLGRAGQDEIIGRIGESLRANGIACSMVTTETFNNPVWAASPAPHAEQVREYANWRVENTVSIGHQLGAQFAVYWPGALGYFIAGAMDELQTLKWYAECINSACRKDIELAAKHGRATLKHCMEAKPFEPVAEILLPTSDSMLALIYSGLIEHPAMVGLNPEYLHELMWGTAPRAALARALMCNKLFHFDINDGYAGKHDVDIAVGLVNPLDWLNVLVLLRTYGYTGPFNLDYKPPRTTSVHGVFHVSFPSAVDRFITLWEMAGEAMTDPVIIGATEALKAGGPRVADIRDSAGMTAANRELLSLHELISHRLFQILVGQNKGRTFSV